MLILPPRFGAQVEKIIKPCTETNKKGNEEYYYTYSPPDPEEEDKPETTILDFGKTQLNIYPNPHSGQFTIEFFFIKRISFKW